MVPHLSTSELKDALVADYADAEARGFGEEARLIALCELARREQFGALVAVVDGRQWDGAGAYDVSNAVFACGSEILPQMQKGKSDFAASLVDSLRTGVRPDWEGNKLDWYLAWLRSTRP